MTQIIIVAKDTLGTLNTHVISEFSKLNKSKHRKNVHFENQFQNVTELRTINNQKCYADGKYYLIIEKERDREQ